MGKKRLKRKLLDLLEHLDEDATQFGVPIMDKDASYWINGNKSGNEWTITAGSGGTV